MSFASAAQAKSTKTGGTGSPASVMTRNLGGLVFDVTMEEHHEDSLQITEHPVEHGAAINDHAFKKPQTCTISAGVSDSTPGNGDRASIEMYDKLVELQAKREPLDIVTGKRLYSNMLIEHVSVVTDARSEHALFITAECREVIIVRTQAAAMPPRSRQAKAAKTGGTEDKGGKQAKQDGSILIKGTGSEGKGYRRAGSPANGGNNG